MFKLQSAFWQFETITVSECCLMKLLRIFYLKIYLDIIIGNSQPRELHCAICIGTLSFPIAVLVCREEASPALTPK